MLPLLEQTPAQLSDWFAQQGQPAYRAAQLRRWLFQKRAVDFEQMTDLGAALRERLAADFQIWTCQHANETATALQHSRLAPASFLLRPLSPATVAGGHRSRWRPIRSSCASW